MTDSINNDEQELLAVWSQWAPPQPTPPRYVLYYDPVTHAPIKNVTLKHDEQPEQLVAYIELTPAQQARYNPATARVVDGKLCYPTIAYTGIPVAASSSESVWTTSENLYWPGGERHWKPAPPKYKEDQ